MLAAAAFASAANIRICDALLPDIAADFRVSIGTAAAVTMTFLLTYGLFQIVIGPVGDRFGKYRIALMASLATGVIAAVTGLAGDFSVRLVLRALGGMCAGAVIPLAIAWIGDVVPYEHRQGVIARFLSGQILGIVFGQAAGGLIADALGWRATFLVVGAAHILAGLGMFWEYRRSAQTSASAPTGSFRPSTILVDTIAILRRTWVRVILVAAFLEAAAFHGALAFVGTELRLRFGLSAGQSGAVLAVFALGALLYAYTAPRLVSAWGQSDIALRGSWILVFGLLLLAASPTVLTAPLATAALGLGFYMLHNTLQTTATQMAPEARGLAVSQFAFWLFLGQSSGVWLAGLVVDRAGARPVFVAAAIILALVAWWFTRKLAEHLSHAASAP
jgi:predicted MFS family arabinose efflux permease